VGYRFAPAANGAGYSASFQVVEAAPLYPVFFEGLDLPAAELQEWLRSRDPLFGPTPGPKLAATTAVLDRYARTIEELLATKNRKEKVMARLVPDTAGHFMITFGPATPLPVVAEARFEGNQAVPAKALLESISGVAYGTAYTETGFRQLLDASIRPLYEAKGLLRVAFTKIATEKAADVKGLVVKVTVDEGERYNLSKVQLAPNPAIDQNKDSLLRAAKFKLDAPADFLEIGVGVARITKMMQRNGYMRAEASVERALDDRLKTVDLTISIHEGPQFTFGKLAIEGLDLHGEAAIKKLWGLKEGKPFDADYPDYFLARVRDDGLFDNLRNTKALQRVDEASHVVDVTLQLH
jgi:outer membrane protein assembly factor BamA